MATQILFVSVGCVRTCFLRQQSARQKEKQLVKWKKNKKPL